jgi:L-threonylcarbamoyladenylate synthase
VAAWPATAQRLAGHFWPGPLTLVLTRSGLIPDIVTAGGPTVALRVPAHPVARALLQAAGVPVAAPSANRSTQLSPTTAQHVLAGLEGLIDVVIDGGPTPGGIESTVVDLSGEGPRLLRPGLLPLAQLEAIVGPLTRPDAPTEPGDSPLPSPGMLPRHYAPRTPLVCLATPHLPPAPTEGWALIRFGAGNVPAGVPCHQLPGNPEAAAAELYALLHSLDALGLAGIYVVLPPDTPEWLAIRDRLLRAAHREG